MQNKGLTRNTKKFQISTPNKIVATIENDLKKVVADYYGAIDHVDFYKKIIEVIHRQDIQDRQKGDSTEQFFDRAMQWFADNIDRVQPKSRTYNKIIQWMEETDTFSRSDKAVFLLETGHVPKDEIYWQPLSKENMTFRERPVKKLRKNLTKKTMAYFIDVEKEKKILAKLERDRIKRLVLTMKKWANK